MTTTMTSTMNAAPVFYKTDEHDHAEGSSTLLGFWLYLMSDCLIFAALFVTYAVLSPNTAGGPAPLQVFDLGLVQVNTAVMLLCSFTCGLAMIAAGKGQVRALQVTLAAIGLLGLVFLFNQVSEYGHLVNLGATPQTSAFLSAYFTLIGTHAIHVVIGLIWLGTMVVQLSRHGLVEANRRRLTCLTMFWNFLDITWVCMFTFVYLMGMLR